MRLLTAFTLGLLLNWFAQSLYHAWLVHHAY